MNAARPPTRSTALFRTIPLCLSLGVALLLVGCQTRQTSTHYTALRVSTYRGKLIAEYIARGPVTPTDGGFQIHAVERRSTAPYPQYNRYPYGWDTTVVGPRIHHWRVAKPDWLAATPHDDPESYAK